MNKQSGKTRRWASLALATTGALSLLFLAACSSMGAASTNGSPQASGSQLWSQNCSRCHNFRSPSEFSDAEWDMALAHMRVRANLTGEEYRSIREFLEASN